MYLLFMLFINSVWWMSLRRLPEVLFGLEVHFRRLCASANDAFWGPQPEHNVRIWLIMFHMFYYICDFSLMDVSEEASRSVVWSGGTFSATVSKSLPAMQVLMMHSEDQSQSTMWEFDWSCFTCFLYIFDTRVEKRNSGVISSCIS